ncbi:hypothetical protein GCM10010260_32080 [Streptomyces filipinensis]|uniref:Uncharacterized protein n=1 Tax=Streptomyces filipinensis TaxID=66887 RepID=A0A918IB38_9ACTN|nr:hypothetical protein GCM10010260_32080 [Streptomyces filipinensis]
MSRHRRASEFHPWRAIKDNSNGGTGGSGGTWEHRGRRSRGSAAAGARGSVVVRLRRVGATGRGRPAHQNPALPPQ